MNFPISARRVSIGSVIGSPAAWTRRAWSPGLRASHLVCLLATRPSETVTRSLAEGVTLSIVPTRRVPPQCLETRAKVTSRLNQILAELEADVVDTLSLMLDIYGNVAENSIANFFIVKGGVLWTPPARTSSKGLLEVSYSSCRRDWGYLLKSDISVFMTWLNARNSSSPPVQSVSPPFEK